MINEQFEEFNKRGIDFKIDENHPNLFHFSLKKDKEKINFISDVSESTKITNSGLLDYELIDGYEAIYSQIYGVVECQLGNLDEYDYEMLCCYLTDYKQQFSHDEGDIVSKPPFEIYFENNFNAKISIGYYSKPFEKLLELKHKEYVLKRQSRFTLKILTNKFENHNEAQKILEEIGNSVLFEIDINFKISIVLKFDQPVTKPSRNEYLLDEDGAIACDTYWEKLKLKYPSEPTSYFLKANIYNDLRFYQFLLYYHCLEYFFPKYSCLHLEKSIKKVLNNISETKINNEKIVHQILNQIRKTQKRESELDLLKVLINSCFNKKENNIVYYIESRDILKQYYLEGNYFEVISKKPIFTKDKNISLEQISTRIYDIRCAIVHKKDDTTMNKIYPTLKNFSLITHDIQLLKYIAERVIIENLDTKEK